ncbi:cation diffusion facilitator family transporter [Microvirga makkahensis]|uniref:Cation diffusion facilitator family transporter n=1 Tax=Microvirga makkahensis TaxID=1128670 RepID=A0A7X3MQX8_9HYPH|nr:cation diffusion facilitator family transporter [Microvirga makkahensis]MXQ11606.1 cation diffusion facilitator family transporter [Microvirga makkahensis]
MPAHHHHSASHAHHGHPHEVGHGRAFVIGIVLNLSFVAIEAGYGFYADSMALLSDAGHNLSDVLGLAIAWGAAILARRAPSERYTYGLRSSSILAALLNALLLMVAVGGIVWESAQRLVEPAPVMAGTMMIVAGIGIVVNGFTAFLFMGGHNDLNIRGAFLHMVADTAVSLGVVLGGLTILWTDATWIDPVLSLVIAAVIVWGTWDLLRQSLRLSLQGVPRGISVSAVRKMLTERPGVARVHHLHVWAISTTQTALTAHLVMPEGHPGDHFLAETQRELRERFGISHATLQIEIHAPGVHDHSGECPLDHHGPGHDHRHEGATHEGHDHGGLPHGTGASHPLR